MTSEAGDRRTRTMPAKVDGGVVMATVGCYFILDN